MRFSPFNPIRFFADAAERDMRPRRVLTYAASDRIMLQAYHGESEVLPEIRISECETGTLLASAAWSRYMVNPCSVCSVAFISGLPEGRYTLGCGDYLSDCFSVAPVETLRRTVLFQYAQRDNMERTDIVSLFNGSILYHEARIPGGFKDSDWVFKVDNEQFFTPGSDPVELSAMDYTDKALTIGSSSGIDSDTAGMVNRILSCPLLFIDGMRYTRSGASNLEIVSEAEKKMFVYSVLLREAQFLNPSWEYSIRLNLRRTPEAVRRTNRSLRRIS